MRRKFQVIKGGIKCIFGFLERLFFTTVWIVKILIYSDLKNHIRKVDNAGVMTIIANGPSLKEEISRIDINEGDFCVVNEIFYSSYYKIIKPRYHVMMDSIYFINEDYFNTIINEVDWDMKLFVPFRKIKLLKLLKQMPNKHIKVIPFHINEHTGKEFFRINMYKRGLSMPMPQNVLIPSIFNAINMGYKEIRLYGVDHSWTESLRVNNRNQVCQIQSHFYDSNNNMEPWYKWNMKEIYKMHEILHDLSNTFKSYHLLKEYADKRGCKIINFTKNSFIDAFERAQV